MVSHKSPRISPFHLLIEAELERVSYLWTLGEEVFSRIIVLPVEEQQFHL
jgi:hypothetical protein